MVEEDAIAGKHVVGLPVVDDYPVCIQLGHTWKGRQACIYCKTATFTFKHFENPLPLYLSEMLCTYQPYQTHRSSIEKLLKVPHTDHKSAGNRSFHFQAAQMWNSLPTTVCNSPYLSSCKKNLKTWFVICVCMCVCAHVYPCAYASVWCVCVCLSHCVCVCVCVRACMLQEKIRLLMSCTVKICTYISV